MDTITNFISHFRIPFQERILYSISFQSLLTFSALLMAYLIFSFVTKRNRNLPPGPYGLPIVGYLPFLIKNVHLQFIEMGKKYGEVFSLQVGSQFVVVLNTAGAIKEGLPKPGLQGRPPHNAFTILERISPFFELGNDVWIEHRRLLVNAMKDLGFGKSRIEEQIQDEVCRFVDALATNDGEPFDPEPLLQASLSNNICSLVFGERYEYGEHERKVLDENLNSSAEILDQASVHVFLPWLRKLPFCRKFMMKKFQKGCRATKENLDIFKKKIRHHDDTLDPKHIRDYVDRYLVEMKRKKEGNLSTTLSERGMLSSVSDIFGAGSETVRTTLLWCLYVLAAFPDSQRKVRQEVGEVVGPDRRPDCSDKERMPYTHAFLMEMMRWKSIVALNVSRYATEDVTVKGYHIPKGSTVMANFWNAHHDPDIWFDPDVFRPERFLSKDGHTVKKSTNFIPFSIGRRTCPGEDMANVEIFLYSVSILQKFRVSFPRGFEPTFEAELALTYKLRPYKIQLTPLNEL